MGTDTGFPQKSQKKVPWFFHDFSRPKYKFPDKKYTHTWFDQGQPTIQLILLVIELIQEAKTTLVDLIKMGNRFSY